MTDIEIAHKAAKLPIGEVAKKIGLSSDELILYGDSKNRESLRVFPSILYTFLSKLSTK